MVYGDPIGCDLEVLQLVLEKILVRILNIIAVYQELVEFRLLLIQMHHSRVWRKVV